MPNRPIRSGLSRSLATMTLFARPSRNKVMLETRMTAEALASLCATSIRVLLGASRGWKPCKGYFNLPPRGEARCPCEEYEAYLVDHVAPVGNAALPGAIYLQIDANHPLPFKGGSIDYLLALDMVHYVENRSSLVRETERVISFDGLILLLHLHNSLRRNVGAGYRFPPECGKDLVEGVETKDFSDPRLLQEHMNRDTLELSDEHSTSELEVAKPVSLVGSRDPKIFRKYSHVKSHFLGVTDHLYVSLPLQCDEHGRTCLSDALGFPTTSFKETPQCPQGIYRRI